MKNSTPLTLDLGLLAMRVMLAVVFLFHGAQKLFGVFDGPGLEGFAGWLDSLGVPLPAVSAFLAALAEFGGGLALATGVGTRLVGVPLAFTMFVAAFAAHSGFAAQSGGMEYPLTLAVMVVGLVLTGPGRLVVPNPLAGGAGAPVAASARS
jgi:putative oxidoreductase